RRSAAYASVSAAVPAAPAQTLRIGQGTMAPSSPRQHRPSSSQTGDLLLLRTVVHMHDAAAIAVEWAAAEGWNPGVDDAERLARADPGAFLCVELDGEVVATVSCALYGDRYGFIGFYIVREDLRGQGLGRPLFDRALARAGDRVVGLDGVLEQQATYERAGFELAHRSARYEGSGGGTRPAGVVDLADVPYDELVAYDAAVFGAPRSAFLDAWVAGRPAGMALAAPDDAGLRGYAIGRRCREGVRAGP